MRILHAPVEVAGQLALQARGQRLLGHESLAWFEPHPFGYENGPDLSPAAISGWRRRANILNLLRRIPQHYDIVHFHSGRSFLHPRFHYADAQWLSRRGLPIIQQFVGSDARLPSFERQRNPWYVNSYGEDDAANRDRVGRWADICHGHVIFQDHSLDYVLGEFFDHVHVVPLCVDVHAMPCRIPDATRRVPVLAHTPSDREFKGSRVIAEAVEQLRARGIDFEYREVHGASHAAAIAALTEADLVVDQVRVGAFGTVAVEAMALGKPVVCHLLAEVRASQPPNLPIIEANPDTLVDVLEEWLTDGTRRAARGLESRDYAEAIHDLRPVTMQLIETYRAISYA